MGDITFLKEEYFNKNINLIKKRGIIAPITDFAILLGGSVSEQNYYNNSNLLEDRTGYYWTSSVGNATDEIMIGGKCVETSTALLVRPDGSKKSILVQRRDVGARPAISYSSISSMCSNEKIASDGVLEVEYGEYPQQVVSKDLQEKLETLYLEGNLQKTGKLYITDSKVTDKHHIFDREFEPQVIMEYKDADGKKYVRVKVDSNNSRKLSNGKEYSNGNKVWVEVVPIKWLIDEENDIALSERILFAGVQFQNKLDYSGDFYNTDIKDFIDCFFSKQIIPSVSVEKTNQEKKKQKTKIKKYCN